jgi:titin
VANAVNQNRIDVAWRDNSPNESGFEVWRSIGVSGSFGLLANTGPNVTSYQNTGLNPVVQYCYQIRAFRMTGGKTSYSDFSNTTCATTPPPPRPNAPSATNAVPSSSSNVGVTWNDNSNNEDGFHIERSLDGGASWSTYATAAANATSFGDNVSADQQVCYRIRAFNLGGDSDPSNVDCTAAPAAPSDLTAAPAAATQAIDLAWIDHSTVEDAYEVQRSTDGYSWSVLATVAANSTSYSDASVAFDTWYFYRVRATKDGGSSDISAVASARVVSGPPTAPTDLDVYPSSSTVASMYWADNASNEDGFRIERGATNTGPWESAGTSSADYAYFDDYDRAPEQQVCYRVIAFNAKGDSDPSNVDCTTPPAAPTDLNAIAVDMETVDLTWTDNSAVEDGYRVYRYTWYCDYWDCYPYAETFDVAADATSYRDTGLTPGTYYWYYVEALKDGGVSDFSNEADVATDSPAATNAVPTARPQISASVKRAALESARAKLLPHAPVRAGATAKGPKKR